VIIYAFMNPRRASVTPGITSGTTTASAGDQS